ncbi:unnamed protein product, partial [marine sediment metagenome]
CDYFNVSNCSLILEKAIGSEVNLTSEQITKDTIQNLTVATMENINVNWSVSCIDDSNNQGSSENYSFLMNIVAPTIDVPIIDPTPAYTNSTLNCSTIAYDINLGAIRINFTWWNDTNKYSNYSAITTNGTLVNFSLTPGIQVAGENWNCTVRAYDGTEYSNYSSSSIKISNTKPVMNYINLQPSTAYTNSTISAIFNFTEIDESHHS